MHNLYEYVNPDVAALGCFIVISGVAEKTKHLWHARHDAANTEHHSAIVGVIGAAACHPAVWFGVKDVIVHVVVYSGHVLPVVVNAVK